MFESLVLVNFGGPRDLDEVKPFLTSLLCDQDVVRTGWPQAVHNLLFSQIAKKRSKVIAEDYHEIGGSSPIFFDTERLKDYLIETFKVPVFTFHRYLPATHQEFINNIKTFEGSQILALPLFPQFSYATTGSCARFFEENLCGRTLEKMEWIPSYATHSSFIEAYAHNIKKTLLEKNLKEEEVCLFYSFHGVPRKFVCFNDPYEKHCQASFEKLKSFFPKADHFMAYQSKFGKGEWLRPYTIDKVTEDLTWLNKKQVLFVPLSFTSDHIETLFEIQQQYIKPLKEKGIEADRVPAIHTDFSWVEKLLKDTHPLCSTAMLVRQNKSSCCKVSHDCCLCKAKVLIKK